MSDKLTETLRVLDRVIAENMWRRPTALHLPADIAATLSAYYPGGSAPADSLVGKSYQGVPIVTVNSSELKLDFYSIDDDLDSKPMVRTCSLEEGGACESCQ